jgi:hypothetical protein
LDQGSRRVQLSIPILARGVQLAVDAAQTIRGKRVHAIQGSFLGERRLTFRAMAA